MTPETPHNAPQSGGMIARFLPLVVVALLGIVFTLVITDEDRNPKEIKSALIGSDVPATLNLPPLYAGEKPIVAADFKEGKTILVNFFASWCLPCRAEHKNLVTLAARDDVILYGIAYKNNPEAARKFLTELGNPYDRIGVDVDGFKAGIDFGISGVPETYIINGDGVITYRQWGPIISPVQMKQLLRALEEANS